MGKYSDVFVEKIREVDGAGSGVDSDLVRGSTPVKLATNGIEVTKTDNSWIKNQCTAWVNFNGTDGTIRDSYNVISVIRDDEGVYTVTFSVEMANIDYIVVVTMAKSYDDSLIGGRGNAEFDFKNTSSVRIVTGHTGDNDNAQDVDEVNLLIFGGKN